MKKLLLVLLFSPLCSYAHSGAEHGAEMRGIMPFADSGKNARVFDFFMLVNHYVDWPGQDPRLKFQRRAPKRPKCIADHPKFGNIHWHGRHRFWFHWGFNTDPRTFPPLVKSLNDAIDDGVISEDDLPEFYDLLMREVSKRNRMLMNEAAKVFGYGQLGSISAQERRQLNAWVTILYSIHVIGDYETVDTDGIASLARIYADINNSIDNLAGKEAQNLEKAKALKASLKKAQGSPGQYLDALEKGFTPFVLSLKGEGYDYRSKFKKMGYLLKR